ncbi:hypothetical protein C8F01DRAFT_1086870 [Mycena amicta]|nr:hypothetical protein C8F01DRAFT_1086870 [Mycena amicta]
MLAREGHTPKLIAIGPAVKDQKNGRLTKILMEFIEGVPPKATDVDQLEAIVRKLGTKKHVHGDLRSPNLLVDKRGKMQILGFDWAGREDQQPKYKIDLSKEIVWHSTARRGKRVCHEHDEFMVEQLKKQLSEDADQERPRKKIKTGHTSQIEPPSNRSHSGNIQANNPSSCWQGKSQMAQQLLAASSYWHICVLD